MKLEYLPVGTQNEDIDACLNKCLSVVEQCKKGYQAFFDQVTGEVHVLSYDQLDISVFEESLCKAGISPSTFPLMREMSLSLLPDIESETNAIIDMHALLSSHDDNTEKQKEVCDEMISTILRYTHEKIRILQLYNALSALNCAVKPN